MIPANIVIFTVLWRTIMTFSGRSDRFCQQDRIKVGVIVDQARTCCLSVIVCAYQNKRPIKQFVECDEKSRVDYVPIILNQGQGASTPTNSKRCYHAADDITPCRPVKAATLRDMNYAGRLLRMSECQY
jgi:hypothetical protein